MIEIVGSKDDRLGLVVDHGQDTIDIGLIGPHSDHDIMIRQVVFLLNLSLEGRRQEWNALGGTVGM